jgi:membrane dipeptidase
VTDKPLPLIVDAHQDLAWNILTFGRDYTQSAYRTRHIEQGHAAPAHNGDTLLGWPEYQRGRVVLVFATMFAAPIRRQEGSWDILCYADQAQAHRLYWQQMDVYRRLADEEPGYFRLITNREDLSDHLAEWRHPPTPEVTDPDQDQIEPGLPVGLVLLMEGGEGVRDVNELPEWWDAGLRILGPAWAGTRFCGGTREPGPLTRAGFELLEAMADLGLILDLSHMDPYAAMQALEVYPGRLICSHANPLAIVPGIESNRFLPDDLIRAMIERDTVIGAVPYNLFLHPNWVRGMRRELVGLDRFAAAIDYICQIAGDTRHIGIGTDFDGGFGWQHVPHEIDTIADLHKVAPLLLEKGYSEADLAALFSGNWLAVLQSALPEK